MTDKDSPKPQSEYRLTGKPSSSSDSLTLASTSPRRRELLEQLGLHFEVAEPTPDDDPADHRPAVEFARDLAAGKAASVAEAPAYAHRWVLGADTVVFDDAEILLKPADRREARRMLARLAGRTHRVVTALALFAPAPGGAGAATGTPGAAPGRAGAAAGNTGAAAGNADAAPGNAGAAPRIHASSPREPLVSADVTAVTFAALSPPEIEWYLDTGEWRSVAGAYRIQGQGAVLIERIEGSYSGVMGLPIRLLYSMLRDTGFRFP